MADLSEALSRLERRAARERTWTRGGEIGTLAREEWDRRDFRVLITRLSSYEDTSLSCTHNLLYALFADRAWFPDWSFLPTARDRDAFAAEGIPWLFGIQSKRPWGDFDAIAVSNSIAQELGNLFWFLRNSGIPLEKSARMADPTIPLIVMGGANAGSASVLFHPDPLVDGIFVGEDLGTIASLFEAIRDGRARGLSKREILDGLASGEESGGVAGFFEPDRVRPTRKYSPRAMESSELYAKMPVNWGRGNAGKAILPISEGCAGFCSFCAESFARKPYREASAEFVLAQARALKAATGAHSIDLFSFNFNMHAGLYALIDGLVPLFGEIGLKSQRFDSIAEDPALVEVEKALGKSVFTCGLEGISERLRAFLNKNLSEDQVRRSTQTLVAASVREIKVFLIATGREGDDDFREWGRFLAWVQGLRTPQGGKVRFVFSVTPLVRFPHTPLEFEPMPECEALKAIVARIVKETSGAGFECREAASAEESLFCDKLVRARSSDAYEAFRAAILDAGFVYDREIPAGVYRLFLSRLSRLDPASVRADFSPEGNASAPWAALDLGVSRGYLAEQYARNSAAREIVGDPKVLCGKGRARLSPARLEDLKAKIARARKDSVAVLFPCSVGERYAGLPREYPALAVAREMMSADGGLVDFYRGWASSFWQAGPDSPAPVWGRDVMGLSFARAGLSRVESLPDDFWARVNAALEPLALSVGRPSPEAFAPTLRIVSSVDLDAAYFAKNGLKHVYEREADGRYAYRFTKDALKKGVVATLSVDKREPGVFVVTLDPGRKFDAADFLQNAFKKAEKGEPRRMSAEAR